MSLVLNGTSQYATGPASLVGFDSGTISLWFKPAVEETEAAPRQLFDVDGCRYVNLKTNSASGVLQTFYNSRVTEWDLPNWTVDTWLHYACRYDKGANLQTPYINGAALTVDVAASGTWGSDAAGTSFWLGSRITANANFWSGRLAQLALYDEILSEADVAELAAGVNPKDFASLNGYWTLAEDETEFDGGTSLTLGGSATFDDGDNPSVDAPTEPASGIGYRVADRRLGYGIMFGRGQL